MCFKHLQPRAHADLSARVAALQRGAGLQEHLDEVKAKLAAERIVHRDLSGRPKHMFSLWQKMQAKGRGIEDIHDVRALRIVVDSKTDCYNVGS